MNIMYATDDNYVEIMAVSIRSLLIHNDPADICLYIVVDGVSDNNKQSLINMITSQGAKVVLIEKPDIRNILGVELRTLRWSDSAFSRLFLKLLFSDYENLQKILYIDCDTLIVDSVKDLYETDIEEYIGAACLECMSKVHKWILGAKSTDNYVNTGVLLLNVERWKSEDIDEKMINFIREKNGKIEYVDQGVINGTISNRFKLVSPRFNLTSLAYDFSYEEMWIYRKPKKGYSKKVWEDALLDPAVVHFTTSFLSIRPWYEGSKHPYARMWKEIHDKTPWAKNGYNILNDRKKRDRIEKIYRNLPSCLAIQIAGIMHSYIKPLLFYFRTII